MLVGRSVKNTFLHSKRTQATKKGLSVKNHGLKVETQRMKSLEIFIRLSILYLSLIKDDKKLMCIIVFGDDKNTKKTDEIVL